MDRATAESSASHHGIPFDTTDPRYTAWSYGAKLPRRRMYSSCLGRTATTDSLRHGFWRIYPYLSRSPAHFRQIDTYWRPLLWSCLHYWGRTCAHHINRQDDRILLPGTGASPIVYSLKVGRSPWRCWLKRGGRREGFRRWPRSPLGTSPLKYGGHRVDFDDNRLRGTISTDVRVAPTASMHLVCMEGGHGYCL